MSKLDQLCFLQQFAFGFRPLKRILQYIQYSTEGRAELHCTHPPPKNGHECAAQTHVRVSELHAESSDESRPFPPTLNHYHSVTNTPVPMLAALPLGQIKLHRSCDMSRLVLASGTLQYCLPSPYLTLLQSRENLTLSLLLV